MRIKPGTPLHVALDLGDRQIAVGRLALDGGIAVLEYAPDFIASGLTINPTSPPDRMLVRARDPRTFGGLHGVFADSLPDAWGDLLLRRRAEAAGITYASLTALDKLAAVGARGMGALTYAPDLSRSNKGGSIDLDILAAESLRVLEGQASEVLPQIARLGGSSGGTRPKILVGLNDANEILDGGRALPSGFTAWLVKFRHSRDYQDVGALEAAYADMARAAGIEISETRLLPASTGPGYFATKRFDRTDDGARLHVVSAAGALDSAWDGAFVDYDALLRLTRVVTRDQRQVEQTFRRAAFNVIAHNHDDHAKQHAFLMDDSGAWRLAPAFDLTFSAGPGGEHYLAVNGKGKDIGRSDLLTMGLKHDVSAKRAEEIVDSVLGVVARFPEYARAYGVSRVTLAEVTRELRRLAVATPPRKTIGL